MAEKKQPKIVAKYIGKGEFYHRIPARDLTAKDWEQLTVDQKLIVQNSSIYELKIPEGKGNIETPNPLVKGDK